MALAAQDGLFTLIERGENGDTFELMSSIVRAHDGTDTATLTRLVSAPATAIITLTITEAAYNSASDGTLDAEHPGVKADIWALRAAMGKGKEVVTIPGPTAPITTAGRLVLALNARRSAGSGPIAVVSCDNLANNALAARAAIGDLAAIVDPALGLWIEENVSFVGTSVDRITPRTTAADLALVATNCGYADSSPVVSEPFRDRILCGEFPAGRPAWESAGALFVERLDVFENRKLWLLNGAHSLLAYTGALRGHTTVAQALADQQCVAWINEFWDEAERHLLAEGLDIPAYRTALLERFGNARIAHHLAQIGIDGSNKLRMRVVPVLEMELAAGRCGSGAGGIIAAWVAFLRQAHADSGKFADAAANELRAALDLPDGEGLPALLRILNPSLGNHAVAVVQKQLDERRLGPRTTLAGHAS